MAFSYDMIAWIPRNARSIINIGCGRGLQGFFLRCDEFATNRKIDRLVGVEVKPDVLAFCKKYGISGSKPKPIQSAMPLSVAGGRGRFAH